MKEVESLVIYEVGVILNTLISLRGQVNKKIVEQSLEQISSISDSFSNTFFLKSVTYDAAELHLQKLKKTLAQSLDAQNESDTLCIDERETKKINKAVLKLERNIREVLKIKTLFHLTSEEKIKAQIVQYIHHIVFPESLTKLVPEVKQDIINFNNVLDRLPAKSAFHLMAIFEKVLNKYYCNALKIKEGGRWDLLITEMTKNEKVFKDRLLVDILKSIKYAYGSVFLGDRNLSEREPVRILAGIIIGAISLMLHGCRIKK